MVYTDSIKARMIRRMMGPNAVSQNALAQETGIPQTTLSRWLRRTGSFHEMDEKEPDPPSATAKPPASRRPEDWSPEEKLQVMAEAEHIDEDQLGEFLRRKGVHREQLDEWRQTVREALNKKAHSHGIMAARRIRELEREVRRKDKALAETAALLVLRKKAEALWGDEDDDTDEKSEP